MLIDKKREIMFDKCRERKRTIDKNLALTRAVIVVPPMLLLAMTVLELVLNLLAMILSIGFVVHKVNISWLVDLISGAGLTYLAACLTVFREKIVLKHYIAIYSGCIIVLFALFLILRAESVGFSTIYCIIALFIATLHKKFVDEDVEMSTLEGYPHFDVTLMKNRQKVEKEITQEEIENLDPDEKIMLERDGKL